MSSKNSSGKRINIIGCGGGVVPSVIHHHYNNNVKIDVVELSSKLHLIFIIITLSSLIKALHLSILFIRRCIKSSEKFLRFEGK